MPLNLNPSSAVNLFTSDQAAHYVYQWFPQDESVPTLNYSDYFRNIDMAVGDHLTVIGSDAIVLCMCISIGDDGPIITEYKRIALI